MKNTEQLIVGSLLTSDAYMRRVIPFLKKEYFETIYASIFHETVLYAAKYNALPSQQALRIACDESTTLREGHYNQIMEILPSLYETKAEENIDFLFDTTEKWCQDRALYLAIMQSIEIINGTDKKLTKDALPSILQDALAISFDTSVGHDYFENADDRHEYYNRKLPRIPFDLDCFNEITKGGLVRKTLNIAMAGTGVGKSMFMCHVAANAMAQGYDVLYITLEMAEEEIAKRIDANLMNITTDDLDRISKKMFTDRVAKVQAGTTGNVIIKEYPTASAHAGHFRALLNELKLKKKFEPQLIFLDYLNICASSRIKAEGGSYAFIKAIAEEVRGLAQEFNVPIMSATQTTRNGYASSDPGLEDTSESFGLPATADLMFALVSNEELEGAGRVAVKQLKNRYNSVDHLRRFTVGIDRGKSKFYDVDQDGEFQLTKDPVVQDDMPMFDKTPSGSKLANIKFS